MTSRARASHEPMKLPPHHHRLWRMEMQGKRQAAESEKAATTSGRTSVRERRLALMRDVDRLKKKLRHEEHDNLTKIVVTFKTQPETLENPIPNSSSIPISPAMHKIFSMTTPIKDCVDFHYHVNGSGNMMKVEES